MARLQPSFFILCLVGYSQFFISIHIQPLTPQSVQYLVGFFPNPFSFPTTPPPHTHQQTRLRPSFFTLCLVGWYSQFFIYIRQPASSQTLLVSPNTPTTHTHINQPRPTARNGPRWALPTVGAFPEGRTSTAHRRSHGSQGQTGSHHPLSRCHAR